MIIIVTATSGTEDLGNIERECMLQEQRVLLLAVSEFLKIGEGSERSFELFRNEVVIGVENNETRAALWHHADSLGLLPRSLIHPSSIVSPSASIGLGTLVLAHAVVNASAILGRGCIVGSSSSVDHDCVLGDYVRLHSGAAIGGGANIRRSATLGENSVVLPRITIGEAAVVGTGAIVLKDVPPYAFVTGNPARQS